MEVDGTSGEDQQQGFCTPARCCSGCCAGFIAWMIFNFGIFFTTTTSDLTPAADASVPAAALILDKAVEECKERSLDMAIQIVEPEGEVIGRVVTPDGSRSLFT